jgi:hypothetical protein
VTYVDSIPLADVHYYPLWTQAAPGRLLQVPNLFGEDGPIVGMKCEAGPEEARFAVFLVLEGSKAGSIHFLNGPALDVTDQIEIHVADGPLKARPMAAGTPGLIYVSSDHPGAFFMTLGGDRKDRLSMAIIAGRMAHRETGGVFEIHRLSDGFTPVGQARLVLRTKPVLIADGRSGQREACA